MINLANPMDVAFAILFVQVFGLKYLVQATDGHSWGMTPISARGRIIALVAAIVFTWTPYLLVWALLGFSPLDLGKTLPELWQIGIPITYAAGILEALALLSFPWSVVAGFLTYRAYNKEASYLRNMPGGYNYQF